jgi:thioredoxin-related protein
VNAIGHLGRSAWLWLALMAPAIAADATKVAWHSDVESAWKITQEHGRPLLVFVTRESCLYCVQMKEGTYNDVAVAGAVNRSFVPLVIDGGGKSQLLRDLRVSAYPSTFVISPQAVILDRIDGYVPPEKLANRLNSLRPYVPVAKVVKDP